MTDKNDSTNNEDNKVTDGDVMGDKTENTEGRQTANDFGSADEGDVRNSEEDNSVYAFRWRYDEQDIENRIKAQKKQKNGLRAYVIVITVAFLICFGLLAGVLFLDGYSNVKDIIRQERTIYVREYNDESGVLTIPEISDKVKPSVVGIKITTSLGSGIGTGIIMSKDGFIATNAHVVADAKKVTVIMPDNLEYDAEVIGSDTLSDLAVVKVEARGLAAAEFGNSDELIVGELAVAIGTPAGLDYAGTVTEGIISAINRDVKIYNSTTGTLEKKMTLIQTSANINPGNSGGPLINEYGKVIGINTLRLGNGYTGIGFAIPINGALEILNTIIETGGDINQNATGVATKRAIIGITGQNVTEKDGYGATGVLVTAIHDGYDAAQSGLMIGDIIVGVNGYQITNIAGIGTVINQLSSGDMVNLIVYRDGETEYISVTLGYEE